MLYLSENAKAVVTLINAQRHVSARFDYSWWILDFAKWDIIAKLNGREHEFVLGLINYHSGKALERARAAA